MKGGAKRALAALACGMIFGLGLAVAQMSNPEKVLSFLAIGPRWDPSLLLVMASALVVTFVGYGLVRPAHPLFDREYHLPTLRGIDPRLVTGAALFGLGWGLAGYCPGPAITSLASGMADPALFVGGLLAGSGLAALFEKR